MLRFWGKNNIKRNVIKSMTYDSRMRVTEANVTLQKIERAFYENAKEKEQSAQSISYTVQVSRGLYNFYNNITI